MFNSTNPATGERIATHPEHDADEIERRLARAADAFVRWRATPVAERTALVGRVADAFEAGADALARLVTAEMGKPITAAEAEIAKCVAGFRYYAENGAAMLAPERVALDDGAWAEARWQPIGPVLAVMPWNFPVWQAVRFLAPALVAGNVPLLKHASAVQGTAAMMEALVAKAGGPEGLFQNLAVRSDAIAAIIADERVAAVTLTGSEGAGASVAEAAGRALKKVVLELGGSDPFVVMPSADLDAAVKAGVTARTQNAGQSCICAKRFIVHRDVADAFTERLVAGMAALRIGDPTDRDVDMGPLSSEEQRQTVLDQLEQARADGGRVVGGEALPEPGAFMKAGAILDLPASSELWREEIFGPIALVVAADDLNDAISRANDTPFGLGASIWTQDAEEQDALVAALESGMVAVNAMLASQPAAPFGGVKRSGHGRELGPWGMREFMNLKAVMHPA